MEFAFGAPLRGQGFRGDVLSTGPGHGAPNNADQIEGLHIAHFAHPMAAAFTRLRVAARFGYDESRMQIRDKQR